MAVYFNVKSLVYKELSPMAKAANCQIVLLDSKTYKSYTDELEKKMDVLGIDEGHYRELLAKIEDWGCLAVLKSNEYYGLGEIAQHFSKVGLEKDDVHMLNSVNAKKYPIWGDFDASIPKKKSKFFYWFIVHVRNAGNEIVME